jgi:hypothetical protein
MNHVDHRVVIARSEATKQSTFPRAQPAARQPKLRASGLEGGASAQLKNGLLRFARNDDLELFDRT